MKFNKITLSLSIIIFFSILNNKLSFSKEKKVVEKTSAKKITTQDELNSKLFNAISNKNIGLVKKLIEEGANVNSKKDLSSSQKAFTPLILSTNLNQKEISRILVNKGADVNLTDKDGNSALLFACENQNKEIVDLLIKNGADVNHKNNNGWNPLLKTRESGFNDLDYILGNEQKDYKIVQELLIKAGAKE